MPAGTLGRETARFLDEQGFAPDDLEAIKPAHPRVALAAQHIRRTHDIHHVLLGCDTSTAEEVGLLAFYLANFEAIPVQVLLAAVMLRPALLGAGREEMVETMDAMTSGWQRGKDAACLFGVDWRDHWARPLEDVRADFNL